MWEQGTVATDAGEVIAKPEMTIEELLATNLVLRDCMEPTGSSYHMARFGPLAIGGHDWFGVVHFFRGVLLEVDLCFSGTVREQMFGTGRS